MLIDTVKKQITEAMKARDEQLLKTVRDLKTRIKTREIEKGEQLTETEFIKIVQTAAKQRKEHAFKLSLRKRKSHRY